MVAREQAAGTYAIWRDGTPLTGGIGHAGIRRRVLVEVAMTLAAPNRPAAILHASAVGMGGGAVLLVGRSGAGKSTLTAALVAAGAQYLGDDLIPLGPDGGHILPFPTALSVKSGAWAEVARDFPELEHQPIHRRGGADVRYLALPLPASMEPMRVRAVIFTSYEPGSGCVARPVTPEEAFALLVDAGSEIMAGTPSARPLARLTEGKPLIHFNYGITRNICDAIFALAAAQ